MSGVYIAALILSSVKVCKKFASNPQKDLA